MTDFLDVKLKEIKDRLAELHPLVDEFHRLQAAERALSGLDGDEGVDGSGIRAPRGASSSGEGKRRGRPKGGGTRAKQALELVRSRPGITIPELADAMDIKQNYLYRVMPNLAEQGLIHKSGRGWHVRGDHGAAVDAGSNGSPEE